MVSHALIDALRTARRVVTLTGSGISAESGVPTFRDAQTGLWARFRPEDLATREAFRRNPKTVWEWYAHRRETAARVSPNPGHLALVEVQRRVPTFTLITQNVDGLHQRAGSKRVIELHGNIARVKCIDEGVVIEAWTDAGETPPRCPRCGGMLRPDVVWFGEMLPPDALNEAIQAARECEVFLSLGTSGVVQPATSIAWEAAEHGALVVEVNPDETPLSSLATYFLRGPAGVILPELVRETWGKSGL